MARAFRGFAVGALPLLVWLVGYALLRPAEFHPWGEWSLTAALFVSACMWVKSAITFAPNAHPSMRIKALCVGPFVGFQAGLLVALQTGWHQPRWLALVSAALLFACVVWPHYIKERRQPVAEVEQREPGLPS